MDSKITLGQVIASTLLQLGDLAHQLQLERGSAALYVDSNGQIFGNEFREHTKETGKTASRLEQLCASPEMDKAIGATTLQKVLGIVESALALDDHRQQVAQLKLPFSRAVNHYTYTILSPILNVQVEIALHIASTAPVTATAYANLLQWKERVGRERAWGAHGFCSHVFKNREFTERMLTLLEEQTSYKRAFLSLAAPAHRELVEHVTSGYIMQFVDDLHDMLANKSRSEELQNISPTTWFELLTGKVERLKIVENKMVEDLINSRFSKTNNASPSPQVSTNIEQHMPLIKALPAFSKLRESELMALLANASVQEYEKGKLLFLQSEPLSRYYLILSGWVKLFKGSDAGDEAVLQMLSAGDGIMEAAILLNIPSAAGAQVVEPTTLLSLPAPLVRQILQDNNAFALNMIGSLSLRSQHLIHQIEQSRLRTASERVGWYLLKLGLQDGGNNLGSIQLPFEKSLIASYLDMTPETFSRTLKKFRAQGFQIKNDTITQPHSKALCAYCDENLSNTCRHKGDHECPLTYLETSSN